MPWYLAGIIFFGVIVPPLTFAVAPGNQVANRAISQAISSFALRKSSISSSHCDLSWVWKERREWDSMGCNNSMEAAYASGQLDYLAAGALANKNAAASLYWAYRSKTGRK